MLQYAHRIELFCATGLHDLVETVLGGSHFSRELQLMFLARVGQNLEADRARPGVPAAAAQLLVLGLHFVQKNEIFFLFSAQTFIQKITYF